MKRIALTLILIMIFANAFLPTVKNECNNDVRVMDIDPNANTSVQQYYYNDPTLYLSNYYAVHYFNKLTTNFGQNEKGSCCYIAMAMLLSYYDTSWDDNVIPENYDMITLLQNDQFVLDLESPGIYTDYNIVPRGVSTNDYYQIVEKYSNFYLQLKLIQLGKEKFGQYKFDTSMNPCGLFVSQIQELLEYYLYEYNDYQKSDVEIEQGSGDLRAYVKKKVRQGVPVLVTMSSSAGGHAFIIYDYNETTDELYGHMGWRPGSTRYTHIAISTSVYTTFTSATTLNFKGSHACSNNYKYSNGYETLNTYCPCSLEVDLVHTHQYRCAKFDSKYHRYYCVCGEEYFSGHIIDGSSGNGKIKRCMACKALLDPSEDYPIIFSYSERD